MGAALAAGDSQSATAERDALWPELAEVFTASMHAADTWNALTARTVGAVRAEG
ncbi:MAG TPA: hypothetical protein QGH28_08020 [Chloroflexota bacterium]|nr:hypothetical protein [Chloroflexota bacterium]|tara:strand:+ start:291 stop:452 length:162 start_codon:yes stop_codon:yes gene_type:complete